jgi:hypothetical protein
MKGVTLVLYLILMITKLQSVPNKKQEPLINRSIFKLSYSANLNITK